MSTTSATPAAAPSAWAPFAHRAFALLWVATVISNIGYWMHDVGAGWLMTELSSSPTAVAGVQAATTLPVFLFALVAGALADIVDRRRLLITINILAACAAGTLAIIVWLGLITPGLLILFTFLLGSATAFMAPAWQAVVPSLVPRTDLPAAISLNSAGINVSRAIGPALAGFLIVAVGIWAPFALNAVSYIGIIIALLWWQEPARPETRLPAEHISGAIAAGWRYVTNSGPMRSTLIRAVAFFLFASAYWALLPLVARQSLSGGPTLYGLLLASVGAGAVFGALLLPAMKKRLGPDKTVFAGTLSTAVVLVILALIKDKPIAIAASAVAGMSWIAVLASLHVSAQTSVPDWVRARGLSFFLTVFFGAMSMGSLLWGQIAENFGISASLLVAASGAVLMIPLVWRARLNQGEELDLAPSMHWPAPVLQDPGAIDKGPVMIQVEYDIPPHNQARYVELMSKLAASRRRGGGYDWTLMQCSEFPDRFVETWFEASMAEHLRHHDRVSGEDRKLQDEIAALQGNGERPVVRHYLSADS